MSINSNVPYRDISPLMSPKSVALIGATDHLTSFGGRVYQQMMGFGFPGRIYPINPRLPEIRGVPCFPNLKSLPEVPDHVGIVLATTRVFDALADCVEAGVKFCTVFSGGFKETGTPEGAALQQRKHQGEIEKAELIQRTGQDHGGGGPHDQRCGDADDGAHAAGRR